MSEKDIQKDDLVGKTQAIRDHDHDMIHDLSKRLGLVRNFVSASFFALIDIFWHSVFEHYCEVV